MPFRSGAALIVLVTLAGCGDADPGKATTSAPVSTGIVAYTVNYPLRYFAERVGGDLVRVEFPAPGVPLKAGFCMSNFGGDKNR